MPQRQDAPVSERQTIRVSHNQGETSVPLNPIRVVVFDMASLDILQALGVNAVIGVPGGNFPAYLSSYEDARYAKVGSLFEPDYEAVNALKPDLIIAGGRSSPKYAELSRIAPTIDMTSPDGDYLGGMRRNVETLARIFGREDAAAARLAALDRSVAALRSRAGSAGKALVVLTTGGRMGAYGPGSRFGVVHEAFGFVPAREGLATGSHGQAITNEFILETNPDWLFVIDRDAAIGSGAAGARVLDNQLVRQTTAWRKGQVVYLDPPSWYVVGPGVQAVEGMVRQLDEALNKAR